MKIIRIIFVLLFLGMFLVQKYLKKKYLKYALEIVLILITFYCVLLSVDMSRVNTFRKPIFTWETQSCGDGCTIYRGLGYKSKIKNYNNGIIEEITLSIFGKVIAGGVQDIKNDDFTIIDETTTCDMALEYIYEDEYFTYSFGCIKSKSVFIILIDGSKISVQDALLDKEVNWGKLITEKYPEMFYISGKETENSTSCNIPDFEMSFYSDKKVYTTNENIKLWVILKYVGNQDKLTIWHAGSADHNTYFNYYITDGKDFNLHSVSTSMLKSSIIDKDKLYTYDYEKTGGWDADAPDADFWENFFKEKDLYLPSGEYQITVSSGFGLTTKSHDVGLKCNLSIKVI
ncbi:MAG: hypothetical protein PHG03_01395 [Bacilli bacterium]|nr:hypothetical protein [Bacilli bacterium]